MADLFARLAERLAGNDDGLLRPDQASRFEPVPEPGGGAVPARPDLPPSPRGDQPPGG